MKEKIFIAFVVLAFVTMLLLATISLLNNGVNLFDILLIIISTLGLADIAYRLFKKNKKK